MALTQVDRYRIEREIARGGVGAVYRARSPEGRPVALKLLLAGRNASRVQRQRVGVEIQSLLRLRHPNVVELLDAGEQAGVPYLVMEWVEGGTLGERLRRSGPLEPGAAAALVQRLAEALQACHAQGVVHRDLKPDNVLLRPRTASRCSRTSGSPRTWPARARARFPAPGCGSARRGSGRPSRRAATARRSAPARMCTGWGRRSTPA